MKPYIFFFYLLISLLLACQNNRITHEDKSDANDAEILSLVFDSLVGDSEDWRNLFLPVRFQLDPEAENYFTDSLRQKQKIDSVQFELDTSTFTVLIDDTMSISPLNLDFIRSLSDKESFQSNFHDVDTAKRQLLIDLIENNSPKHLDLGKMKSSNDITVKYRSSSSKKDDEIIIGHVTFSGIAYNHDQTMACIHSDLVCGGECGHGNIYFLEKRNGKWTITLVHTLWVS